MQLSALIVELAKKSVHQHIAIPSELKKVKSTLGGWQTKLIMPMIKRRAPRMPAKKE